MRSGACTFAILAVMAVAQMVQYCVASLFVAKLPGNRYVNGIIFGCGECFAMIFSDFLMNRFMDLTAFYIVYACGLTSYLTLIFFPNSAGLTYIANVLLITSVGGWFNTLLLVLELRVPPQRVGTVSALTRTMAVGAAVVAPTVASLEAPWPYITLMSLAGFACLLTLGLPKPGLHLPAVQKTGENTSVLIDRQSNAPTHVFDAENKAPYPMTNYSMHVSSFHDTFTERFLNVSRPQLNETNLDPEVYLNEEASWMEAASNNGSALRKAWLYQKSVDEEEE